MASFKESIRKAVKDQNGKKAGRLAEVLRFEYGMDYQDTFELFKRTVPGLTLVEFDSLMYQFDTGGQ